MATPTLSWYHNNVELRQSVKFMKRYAGDDYYFIINRARLQDRGEYIIRAENHYGSREEVVFLNVQRTYIFKSISPLATVNFSFQHYLRWCPNTNQIRR